MDLDPVLLSRLQFAWVIGWHILLPAFTVGAEERRACAPPNRMAKPTTYRAAVERWRHTPIILRQGARVVHDSRRPRVVK
jgi:hypothetical protein